MKLVVKTQYYENYGDEVNPRFKPKGGCDYIAAHLPYTKVIELGEAGLLTIVNKAAKVFVDNPYVHEYIVDWELLEDDQHTDDELMQLEYDGKIFLSAEDISEKINHA